MTHLYSNINRQSHMSYPLTSFNLDDDILTPIYDFMDKPDNNKNLKSLIDDCINAWLASCHNDYFSHISKFNFKEEARDDSYVFLKDGSFYKQS